MAAHLTMTDAKILNEVELWRDRVAHNCPKNRTAYRIRRIVDCNNGKRRAEGIGAVFKSAVKVNEHRMSLASLNPFDDVVRPFFDKRGSRPDPSDDKPRHPSIVASS
jgi:hypothetical protein